MNPSRVHTLAGVHYSRRLLHELRFHALANRFEEYVELPTNAALSLLRKGVPHPGDYGRSHHTRSGPMPFLQSPAPVSSICGPHSKNGASLPHFKDDRGDGHRHHNRSDNPRANFLMKTAL